MQTVTRHLEEFPRQFAALETAMASFGENFELAEFKEAFSTRVDLEAYNRVQAVERGVGRVQNFVAELAESGARLADIPVALPSDESSRAERAFEALRDANVISVSLCRRLIRAQKARSRIEHSYVKVPAGDVHRTAELVLQSAREFIIPYARWIEPHLNP
jgi:uncharacterized protein YutE (UPF0331/DUF86 family)